MALRLYALLDLCVINSWLYCLYHLFAIHSLYKVIIEEEEALLKKSLHFWRSAVSMSKLVHQTRRVLHSSILGWSIWLICSSHACATMREQSNFSCPPYSWKSWQRTVASFSLLLMIHLPYSTMRLDNILVSMFSQAPISLTRQNEWCLLIQVIWTQSQPNTLSVRHSCVNAMTAVMQL